MGALEEKSGDHQDSKIYHVGTMNVCTKLYANPRHSCPHISVDWWADIAHWHENENECLLVARKLHICMCTCFWVWLACNSCALISWQKYCSLSFPLSFFYSFPHPFPLQLCLHSPLSSSLIGCRRHVCGSVGSSHVNRHVLPPADCQNPSICHFPKSVSVLRLARC